MQNYKINGILQNSQSENMPKSHFRAVSGLPDSVAIITREPPAVEFDEEFRRTIGPGATLAKLHHNVNAGKIEFWFESDTAGPSRLSAEFINRLVDSIGGPGSPAAVATGPVTIIGHCAIFNLLNLN